MERWARIPGMILVAGALLASPAWSLGANCALKARELESAERQQREWKAYQSNNGPGSRSAEFVSGLVNLDQAIRLARREYAQQCGPGAQGQREGGSNPSGSTLGGEGPDGEGGPDHRQGGDPSGRGGPDPMEDPFAQVGGGSGAGASGGAGAQEDPFSSVGPKAGGGSPRPPKEPPRTYDGKPCIYFTPAKTACDAKKSPPWYADGAMVCYQNRMYECVDRVWRARADCGAYAAASITHAEKKEWASSFNTCIYEEEEAEKNEKK